MKKKCCIIILLFIICICCIGNKVYAKALSAEDFIDCGEYVFEDMSLNINSENAVGWVNEFLRIKYDAKNESDDVGKDLATVCNNLLNRINPKNKKYDADIYSALYSQKAKTDTSTLIDKINEKILEFKTAAKEAGKNNIAKKFKGVQETTGEQTKQDSEERDTQEKENNDKLIGQTDDTIYSRPEKKDQEDANSNLDDMIDDADKFTSNGDLKYNADDLSSVSNTIFNILLTVGIIIAVLMGVIIGIKLMISGVEEKAQVKKLLMPYVVGCIIIFGGFGIWKLVVTILQNI
mgnify:FL=1